MTEAAIGWGSEFWLNNGTVLTECAEVFSVAPPGDTVDEVDATHYKSPNRRREFITGLIDGGSFEVQMNYVPGSVTDLLFTAAKASGAARAFKIAIPTDDGKWAFQGTVIITGYEKEIPVDDRMTATATCRVTGDVTEAADTE